jgi:hypothetical protein
MQSKSWKKLPPMRPVHRFICGCWLARQGQIGHCHANLGAHLKRRCHCWQRAVELGCACWIVVPCWITNTTCSDVARTLDQVAAVWRDAQDAGFGCTLINIGGGFPAAYDYDVEAPNAYAAEVMDMVNARFPDATYVMAEPGRGMVAEAGVIAAEVMLVSRKSRMICIAGCIWTLASFLVWPKLWTKRSVISLSPTKIMVIWGRVLWLDQVVTARMFYMKNAP